MTDLKQVLKGSLLLPIFHAQERQSTHKMAVVFVKNLQTFGARFESRDCAANLIADEQQFGVLEQTLSASFGDNGWYAIGQGDRLGKDKDTLEHEIFCLFHIRIHRGSVHAQHTRNAGLERR